VPLLMTALATHFHWIAASENFEWLHSWPAIIAFGTASLIEVLGYYIPMVDHVLDFIASPLALVAGALLAATFIPVHDPMVRWVAGIIVGAGAAGTVQTGSVLARLLSGKATLTAANPVVSTGENTAAVGGSLLSFFTPVLAAVVFSILIICILFRLKRWHGKAKITDKGF
jgi:hypothetical protein